MSILCLHTCAAHRPRASHAALLAITAVTLCYSSEFRSGCPYVKLAPPTICTEALPETFRACLVVSEALLNLYPEHSSLLAMPQVRTNAGLMRRASPSTGKRSLMLSIPARTPSPKFSCAEIAAAACSAPLRQLYAWAPTGELFQLALNASYLLSCILAVCRHAAAAISRRSARQV